MTEIRALRTPVGADREEPPPGNPETSITRRENPHCSRRPAWRDQHRQAVPPRRYCREPLLLLVQGAKERDELARLRIRPPSSGDRIVSQGYHVQPSKYDQAHRSGVAPMAEERPTKRGTRCGTRKRSLTNDIINHRFCW